MPVTPFHFGPGAMIHAIAPKQVSFLAFCAANVLVDIEPLHYMMTGQFPVHRFFHTYVGASVIVLATAALFLAARKAASLVPLPNLFDWKHLGIGQVIIGAALGIYSHILLDSVMHADIEPFQPFSEANPMLGLVSSGTLHWSCVGAGAFGLAFVAVRTLRRERPPN